MPRARNSSMSSSSLWIPGDRSTYNGLCDAAAMTVEATNCARPNSRRDSMPEAAPPRVRLNSPAAVESAVTSSPDAAEAAVV